MEKRYALGEGVVANQQVADEYFKRAAQSNNPKVLTRLGVMYARGYNTALNKQKSIEFFQKASDLKNEVAKKGLKEMQKKRTVKWAFHS